MLLKSVYVDFFADSRVVIALVQTEMAYGRPQKPAAHFPGVLQRRFYQAAVMNIGTCDCHSQRNTLTIHMRCILPPLRPLSVGLRPRPSVADFLRARRGLQQGAVHSLPLGVDADLFPIFSKKDAKNLRHDASFVPSLEVLVDRAF